MNESKTIDRSGKAMPLSIIYSGKFTEIAFTEQLMEHIFITYANMAETLTPKSQNPMDKSHKCTARIFFIARKHFKAGRMAKRYTHFFAKLSSLDSNPDRAKNCHPGVVVNVCAAPRMEVKQASHLSALVGGH